MTPVEPGRVGRSTLDRYWSIFRIDDRLVDEVVAGVFTPDAEVASAVLRVPARGHAAIAEHMRRVRTALGGEAARHLTEVQWVHDVARWCWRTTGGLHPRRGMDVVRLSPDGHRIELLVVFDGLLPVPA